MATVTFQSLKLSYCHSSNYKSDLIPKAKRTLIPEARVASPKITLEAAWYRITVHHQETSPLTNGHLFSWEIAATTQSKHRATGCWVQP